MSSILNSISQGDLQVQQAPKEKPIKEDSIIEVLQNPEIEFETCPKLNKIDNHQDFDTPEVIIQNLIENLETDFTIPNKSESQDITIDIELQCNKEFLKLEQEFDVSTGFGKNNDLFFETKCKLPELKVPLYKSNYLTEFVTEEEKAAARHALGLYNKGDVVAMSLLTAEDFLPEVHELNNYQVKQLRKGDVFFAPVTTFDSVYDNKGVTLTTKFNNISSLLQEQQKEIVKINSVSGLDTISSLGDVKLFLQGFTNNDNLHTIIDDMNQEMLRFENTGQIETLYQKIINNGK